MGTVARASSHWHVVRRFEALIRASRDVRAMSVVTPIADKMLRCREYPLWANSEHALEKVPCAGEALACALIEAVLASHLAGLGGAERVKS
jgi:hypothetical protein